MKLNFNFSGKTLLKDWWKIVRDNFTAIQTDHNELSDSVNTHKTAEVIDHPDKSVTSTKIADKAIRTAHIANYAITKDKVANGAVTTDKIAANSITVNELTLDIVANLGKANTFLYSDGEPIYLSECKDTGGIGYELPDDIPVNVFFKLENDTDSALTKFQSHDDYYTTLSCDIAPGEVRICVLIQEEVGGADPQNGYLFVLDDNSIRKLLNDKAPTNHASGATTYGVGDATNYGHLKLSDSTASVSSTGSGIAATPKAVKTISDTLSTEISDRQAADNELKAKISDINTELTTDNLFYDLSKYVNSDNTLVTDDSGVQYLSYSGSFENGTYLYHNFVVDNFRRKPKTETTLELTFNVALRHIAVDDCDSGGLNKGETDVLITYTDTTTETFGQSYYTATDTGDKTITINGTSETYKTTKFKIEIPVKKEIKSISFRIVSDNYYTNGDPTGNACKQKTLIQSAVCYDDECVAVLRDDINTNTSKITANTTKITEIDKTVTDISKNQIFVVCDGDHDELKIQAALSRAIRGTVVYIMGDCVLTNENTQDSGLVSGFGHYNAILNVGIRVTLDGTYCSSITFKNTNPAARQVIFFLGIMAKLKNINFQEDNTTCTQTSVNPMILFGNSNAIVDNCVLGKVYDVNQDDSTVGNIIMCSGSKFTNNVIDGWCLKTKTNIGACMKFTKVFVDNNKFTNIWTTDNSDSGYLMSVSASIFINNVFEDNTIPQGEIYFSGNNSLCNHNIFNSSDIGNITLAGNTANNVFISLDLNECIAVKLRSICNDNTFFGLKVKEGDCAFDLGVEATFANNYIKNLSIITTDSTEVKGYNILYANKAFCRDNVILLSAATNTLENLYVIEANASSVVTGNVTSASSIGLLDEGCVAEGNTVAWS
jgi:hypothetical protein